MSMSLMAEKWESSSSRQRDVIELIFTCEMVMLCVLFPLRDLGDDDEAAEPTEAARRPGPGNDTGALVRCRRRSSGCPVTQ